jgi:hypothetical protein
VDCHSARRGALNICTIEEGGHCRDRTPGNSVITGVEQKL